MHKHKTQLQDIHTSRIINARYIAYHIALLCLLGAMALYLTSCAFNTHKSMQKDSSTHQPSHLQESTSTNVSDAFNDGANIDCASYLQVLLSFVGDIVLGDYEGAIGATFNAKFAEVNSDIAYFTQKVREVLMHDDLSIGNMEGVLSDKPLQAAWEKPFLFKGMAKYAEILRAGGFEVMNLANNHTRDYGQEGFLDTARILQEAGIGIFGEGRLAIYTISHITIGFAGHRGWNLAIKPTIMREIQELRDKGAEIVIFSFHWGQERAHYPNATQQELARFAIDKGADVVIGHHPHVLQGIEEYKGKKIIYSLGNFLYGGAKNPADKDTMIYQIHILKPKATQTNDISQHMLIDACATSHQAYINGIARMDNIKDMLLVHSIIPASISSTTSHNNYQPIIYPPSSQGFLRILQRVETYSKNINQARP